MKKDITKQDIIAAIQNLAKKKGRNWLTRLEFQAESEREDQRGEVVPSKYSLTNRVELWIRGIC